MKKSLLALGLVTVLAGCSDNEVGDVSLGMFTMNDLHSITQLL
ncbi:TPA: lipoprotein [Vibrio harveyi]|nr:lipoprotein [Vibrio harveyi]